MNTKPSFYGIKILDPESGRIEMFGDLYKTLQECEYTIELFKKTSMGRHVELVPVEIRDLASQEQPQDQPEVKEEKAEEPVPNHKMHKETYKSNPDGTVDVEIDGEKVTDPEKQKEAKERLDHMFDDIMGQWPWFRDLNKRGIDPLKNRHLSRNLGIQISFLTLAGQSDCGIRDRLLGTAPDLVLPTGKISSRFVHTGL